MAALSLRRRLRGLQSLCYDHNPGLNRLKTGDFCQWMLPGGELLGLTAAELAGLMVDWGENPYHGASSMRPSTAGAN